MKTSNFDAQITAIVFDAEGAVFALGDGSVRFEDGAFSAAHDGAILCAVVHPSGNGVVTGGDDGRLIWHRRADAGVLATSARGQWIDAVDASAESGLIAFSAGKTLSVIDAKDAGFRRDFQHERTVSGVAFEPKGRRIATSTYGGAALWFARIAEQKPTFLKWAGSHTAVTFSPDGAFVVTAMQDAQLHGWRLKDQKNMRMGGYPSKVRAMSFLSNGQLLATAGASGAVLWPFVGANGPMGREATEIGYDEGSLVALVASQPRHGLLAAGLTDGRVWLADPAGQGLNFLKADKGSPITALAMSADAKRVAWADEDGNAGVSTL
ncbi:WD40 repeat domain-containing protein [Brevundimonas sp. UBA2416]|uniref:WD40 repeat domain-containing protein n=1 Tax=Brevundimonas sp. UBA2416 TaxID=1946124 RepID=UPI0025BECAA7|nr:WD40 repeat domain-containing protein [Brevundimonas sp. UBA2416]HRJ62842.1 WD40 repeat domain-containing protein [Brevundimonas sp.]